MTYLLDTDTCIDLLRQRTDVVERLRRLTPGEVAVSTITSYELFCGVEKCFAPDTERSKIDTLLQTVGELPLLATAARAAACVRGQLERIGCPIGPYDTLLAGHAISAGLTLVTADLDAFRRVNGLLCETWRQPSPQP